MHQLRGMKELSLYLSLLIKGLLPITDSNDAAANQLKVPHQLKLVLLMHDCTDTGTSSLQPCDSPPLVAALNGVHSYGDVACGMSCKCCSVWSCYTQLLQHADRPMTMLPPTGI